MGPKRDSKTNSTSSPCCSANNQDDILEEIKQLMATTSARNEKWIDSVEEQIKKPTGWAYQLSKHHWIESQQSN